jgi:endonuclease YncB( thermonuclease family)
VLRRISWFWVLVVALFGASALFASGVRARRLEIQRAGVSLSTGAVVSLSQVIDGDTVVVRTDSGDPVTVRILGVKAFEASSGRDPADRFGQEAVAAIGRIAADKPIHVQLGSPAKDKYGRTLAVLSVNDTDLGLSLVGSGLVLVYTAYPFAEMAHYLEEQAKARMDRRGLWGEPTAAARADGLLRQWRAKAP